jgi:hypothetical protein
MQGFAKGGIPFFELLMARRWRSRQRQFRYTK